MTASKKAATAAAFPFRMVLMQKKLYDEPFTDIFTDIE